MQFPLSDSFSSICLYQAKRLLLDVSCGTHRSFDSIVGHRIRNRHRMARWSRLIGPHAVEDERGYDGNDKFHGEASEVEGSQSENRTLRAGTAPTFTQVPISRPDRQLGRSCWLSVSRHILPFEIVCVLSYGTSNA